MRKWIAILMTVMMVLTAAAGALADDGILRPGDQGEEVKGLQRKLIELEYLEGEATGVYDEATEEAVRRFQQDHWLLVTGMADNITRRLLETETVHAQEIRRDYDVYEESEAGAMICDSYMPLSMNTYAPNSKTAMGAAYEEWPEWNTDEYSHIESNRFLSTMTSPLSTFAADVDTSSYAQLRRRILNGEKVPADSIRIEEMLNYFHYDYKQPDGSDPFGVTVEYADCPWNSQTKLLQIGLQAKTAETDNLPGHNLVFLIDTSGSMEGADRLDLVKRAFLMLLDELRPEDTVSIVTYASQDRVVIEGVPASEKTRIMEAISELEAHGSTNGSAGIIRSYDPDTGLATVQPGLSGKESNGQILTAPILTEVPVFLPSSDFIVFAGSFCLLFFMDGCLDGFLASRQPVLPASPRHHDLSDAIALVGWFPLFGGDSFL